MRIALCGTQGSGKTTLATKWSEWSSAALVRAETKSFMPSGIQSHLDILRLAVQEPSEGIEFQRNVIEARHRLFMESPEPSFISDRAVVDSFIYYTLHNSMFSDEETNNELRRLAIKSLSAVDVTVVLHPSLDKIENNGVRLSNRAYYDAVGVAMYDFVVRNVPVKNILKYIVSDDLAVHVWTDGDKYAAYMQEPGGFASIEDRMSGLEAIVRGVETLRISNGDERTPH